MQLFSLKKAMKINSRVLMIRALPLVAGLFMAAPVLAASDAAEKPAPAPNFQSPEPDNLLYLDLSTGGRVTVLLRPDRAPAHVERIKELARRGFYDGVIFHRVIPGFMAQTGDPTGTGQGGSDLPDLGAEFNDLPHVRGAVSMARAESKDSANSQFFIMFDPVLRLDRHYTVFGRVIDGIQWVDKIDPGEPPANPSKVIQASIGSDQKAPPEFPASESTEVQDLLAAEAAKLGLDSLPQ